MMLQATCHTDAAVACCYLQEELQARAAGQPSAPAAGQRGRSWTRFRPRPAPASSGRALSSQRLLCVAGNPIIHIVCVGCAPLNTWVPGTTFHLQACLPASAASTPALLSPSSRTPCRGVLCQSMSLHPPRMRLVTYSSGYSAMVMQVHAPRGAGGLQQPPRGPGLQGGSLRGCRR